MISKIHHPAFTIKGATVNQDILLLEKEREAGREPKVIDSSSPLYRLLSSELGQDQADHFYWDTDHKNHDLPDSLQDYSGFIQLKRINDIPRINKFMEAANRKMENGQLLVISMETKNSRKKRILNKYPSTISKPYYVLDFILKRVFPKWKPTRRLYFWITKGRNRVLSKSEGMARMICCGFEIVTTQKIGYRTYIIGKKVEDPAYDMEPTYGALVRLSRVGKDGKMFDVYKMRTMYPYSEYLQSYIYDNYDLKVGGKFDNDFRLTYWGRIFRKYWLDELPMFINFFKGEMKIVGVRPLSRQYFELYPKDLQELRTQVKPGLVPPFYADMPKGMEEIQQSERDYLNAYLENPVRTDIRYFFKSVVNILFKGARSQ